MSDRKKLFFAPLSLALRFFFAKKNLSLPLSERKKFFAAIVSLAKV